MSTFTIAEIGSCHDGWLDKALRVIHLAADCGFDCAKAQYWSSASRLAGRRNAHSYLDIYRHYQIPAEWLPHLKAACDSVGLEFMCTTYLPEDIATVAPYVQRFKVSSFEAGDDTFIAAHAPFQKPLIVSTGMMGAHEAWNLVASRFGEGVQIEGILHCTSAYPCPIEHANLEALRYMWKNMVGGAYVGAMGYSDHTAHPLMGALAVAAGAEIIEAHIRLDDTDPQNPDYAHSLSPELAKQYVTNIRFSEKAMGDGAKKPQECEKPMMAYRVKS